MQAEDLWNRTLPILQHKMPGRFQSTFQFCRALDLEGELLTIEVPRSYPGDRAANDRDVLEQSIYEATNGARYQVAFKMAAFENFNPAPSTSEALQAPQAPMEPFGRLNSKYTFASFVVGTHSRFAHAAAMAVSDKPGGTYNPLFIYGASGLGKTHLMHAIGHRLLATNPRAKVVYVSSEKFTNEVITGIRTDSMNDLRKRYRDLDLLLIDDIQFIERTTATQEEFFHTFNALYEHGKQIVIAGDRPPKQLPQIEERLRTRFEWGLQTDIQAPDLETRIAILRKKADLETIVVPDDVLDFIAGAMCDNVRELEGAYLKVVAFASIHGRPVSRELAIEVLGTANVRPITMARICEVVAEAYNVTAEDLVGPRRVKEFTLPRHIACYLVREMTGASFQAIGRHFRRDHTSIMHGIKNISEELLCDTNLGANIAHLKSRISQR